MCGIAGSFEYRDGGPADRRSVADMVASQRHRGPDDSAVEVDGPFALGLARLSIIDVAGGRQPLSSEDGAVAVVCNGEIYNHRELRAQLVDRGHRFSTGSDAEVIVHLYQDHGPACVERLRGMFAFALRDSQRRRLLLARDRLGKKPLYYADDGSRIAFASELKALVAGGAVGGEPDAEALDLYLAYGYVPAPWSALRGAYKLPAGHLAVVDERGLSARRYWDVEFAPPAARSDDQWRAELDDLLEEAVEVRLESEVPLGAFLSGGLDSGTVVSYMPPPVITHTVGFADPALDESADAALVAAALGSDHGVTEVTPDLAAVLPRIAWHLDEPFADPSAVPTWYLCAAMRGRVTVALSGDGGDELFAGYPGRYGMPRWEARARRLLPALLRQRALPALARHWPRSPSLPRALRLGRALENVAADADHAYFLDRCQIRPQLAARLLRPGSRAGFDPFCALAPHLERAPTADPLARALYLDLKTWLADDALVKVDRMSMAHGLEVRSPLLDHRLVEFAARLPSDLKLARGRTKVLLRQVAASRLPRRVVEGGKRGFAPPISAWLRLPAFFAFAHETLLARDALVRDLCDETALRALLRDHAAGKVDAGWPLWSLLMLESWNLYSEKPRQNRTEARVAGSA